MSIATTPLRADYGVQASQKMGQPVAASKPQAGLLSARASTVTDQMSKLGAAQAAATVKAGEVGKQNAEQTRQSLLEINKVMDALSISVQFQMDPDLNQAIIKVVDQQSGKVIRQFPSEDAMRIAKALDNLKGLLFAKAV